MRRRLSDPRTALAEVQGLKEGRVPEFIDLLVAEGPRDQSEAEFVGMLRHGLNEAFGSQGLHCAAISETIGNNGYRILLRDREKRDVWGHLSFQDVIDLGEQHGAKAIFDRALGLVVESVRKSLAERDAKPENLVEAAVREHAKDAAEKTFGHQWKETPDGNA